jgi:4-aminobutyrate aminotransferase
MKKKASQPARKPDISTLKSEGDLNLSPHRQQWLDNHIDEETLERLNQDTNYFLRQSLSTPSLNVLKS